MEVPGLLRMEECDIISLIKAAETGHVPTIVQTILSISQLNLYLRRILQLPYNVSFEAASVAPPPLQTCVPMACVQVSSTAPLFSRMSQATPTTPESPIPQRFRTISIGNVEPPLFREHTYPLPQLHTSNPTIGALDPAPLANRCVPRRDVSSEAVDLSIKSNSAPNEKFNLEASRETTADVPEYSAIGMFAPLRDNHHSKKGPQDSPMNLSKTKDSQNEPKSTPMQDIVAGRSRLHLIQPGCLGNRTNQIVPSRIFPSKRPMKCSLCSKNVRADNFQVHMRSHTGEKPYQCPICPFRTANPSSMPKHLRLHDKGRQIYRCQKCSFSTIYKSNYCIHRRSHQSKYKQRYKDS